MITYDIICSIFAVFQWLTQKPKILDPSKKFSGPPPVVFGPAVLCIVHENLQYEVFSTGTSEIKINDDEICKWDKQMMVFIFQFTTQV